MHGEYLEPVLLIIVKLGSPPYARGIRSSLFFTVTGLRITPVCTGNTVTAAVYNAIIEDHPRMHGEYYGVAKSTIQTWGSPPYARGILTINIGYNDLTRITPVCTGNTVYWP